MRYVLIIIFLLFGCVNHQEKIKTELFLTDSGTKIGTVWLKDTKKGLLVEVNLNNLPQGEHGFHIHENPDCSAHIIDKNKTEFAYNAGGHFDPYNTNKHLGPNGGGHLGDLPYLSVGENKNVKRKFYLKNIKVKDFKNRSIIIHSGGDNYKDIPLASGGGGARIACGVIK